MEEDVINLDLIEQLLEHISTSQGEGAILVFMPGLMDVRSCCVGAVGARSSPCLTQMC